MYITAVNTQNTGDTVHTAALKWLWGLEGLHEKSVFFSAKHTGTYTHEENSPSPPPMV